MSGAGTIALPDEVAQIYKAVARLEARYPGRKFTPDGHLVGSVGEVIAAERLGLTLLPASEPAHDAVDAQGRLVQIKLTAKDGIALNADCDRLVVLQIVDPAHARIVYDGDGAPVWERAGRMQKNGQRRISFHRMKTLAGWRL